MSKSLLNKLRNPKTKVIRNDGLSNMPMDKLFLDGLSEDRQQEIQAIFADITCGEMCWNAKDVICRCSCMGVNHGIYRRQGPDAIVQRTSKIDGTKYKLVGVGFEKDIMREGKELYIRNEIEKGNVYLSGDRLVTKNSYGRTTNNERTYIVPYYWWNIRGGFVRIKPIQIRQAEKWKEVVKFIETAKNKDDMISLLWQKVEE